jgi:hypothetical protein
MSCTLAAHLELHHALAMLLTHANIVPTTYQCSRPALSCCRWRSLLDALPLPVKHLSVSSAVDLYELGAATLHIRNVCMWIKPDDIEMATDALASVLASRRFQRCSGASLRKISSPAFTLSSDIAVAFPQLKHLRRLDARTMPAQLPAGLKELVFEGDGQQLTRLPPNIFSTCPRLRELAMFNMVVDAEQLPRSLSELDLVK